MIIIELIFNLSLLIAVSVLSGFIVTYFKRTTIPGIVAQGLLFGIVALIGMINPSLHRELFSMAVALY